MTGESGPMQGRVCVVTGASGGMGRETARALALRGATVAMVARSRERGQAAREDVARPAPGARVELLLADLAVQADVRRLAGEVVERFGRVDVLVNNAAHYGRRRTVTPDGIETQLAVNHLSPFLLTTLLLPTLLASAPARVVTVSSAAHKRGRIRWNDLQAERRYRGFGRYSDTKLANVLFTRELARRTAGTGVTANSLHPGLVGTELLFGGLGILRLFRRWMKTPEEGARTAVHLASSPEVEGVTGLYFEDERPVDPAPQALDDEAARRLWAVSEELVGARPTE